MFYYRPACSRSMSAQRAIDLPARPGRFPDRAPGCGVHYRGKSRKGISGFVSAIYRTRH